MSTKGDDLGTRMKSYENISRIYLTARCPAIVRIDGKAFHTFLRGFKRPFDRLFIESMQGVAKYLCENIMGCKLAYTQSDEISLLLTDYETPQTQPWFGNNLQKICSISASMATLAFKNELEENVSIWYDAYSESWNRSPEDDKLSDVYLNAATKGAMFDARAFIIPKEEVCNYFIWRQQDASRNSIQMVAQANFSHKQLQKKNTAQLQEMLHEEKGINWNDFDTVEKRGSCVVKKSFPIIKNSDCGSIATDDYNPEDIVWRNRWVIDDNIPIFTKDRNYIEKLL